MVSWRVVGAHLLLLLTTLDASAMRYASDEQLAHNVGKWTVLQRMVNVENKKNKPDSFVNPFNNTGFLSKDRKDGSAVVLSAKNIVPDIETTRRFFSTDPNACDRYPPPDGYERDAVPMITIAVFSNVTEDPDGWGIDYKFLPYICALKRTTALMIFLDISQSLVAPPLGDLCNTMILIRQALHSARFLVVVFSENTELHKAPLCRPIVWGNLSPYLQIRRDRYELAETLFFLGSKGGTINFGLDDDIHNLAERGRPLTCPKRPDEEAAGPCDQVKERQRLLSNLYATMDNTCQLAYRSRRVGENKMTGPRFSFPSVEGLKAMYQTKRKALTTYIESEGQDLSHINMLQIVPVLLFAGTITMFLAINPQYVANDYERIVEVVEEEGPDGKNASKVEKKPSVLDAIKNLVSDPMNVSHGRRVKKKKTPLTKTTEQPSTSVAEVTAEGDFTVTARATDTTKKADDKSSKKKKKSRGKGSASKKKLISLKKDKTKEKTDNEVTAEGTMGTTAGTEVTAGATITAPASS